MRRCSIVVVVAVAVYLTSMVVWQTPARSQTDAPQNAKPPAAALPVSQVVLFSSGVGYFQREGEVERNARIELSFLASDIDELLKSMIVPDMSGGQVRVVSFDSPEHLERTLTIFAIDLE